MSARTAVAALAVALFFCAPALAIQPPALIASSAQITDFGSDPLTEPAIRVSGDVKGRLTWNDDDPIYPGDAPGSLSVLYRSDLAAGMLGWPLPRTLGQNDDFTAMAIFVLDPKHHAADPNGYFQISWGLWNSETTGLNRSGSPASSAGDSFELLEYDYFPNVSPFWGGPFISPTLFGVASPDHPLFPVFGSFANMSFASTSFDLPRGLPLVAAIDHDPSAGTVTFYMWEVTRCGKLNFLEKATTVVPLAFLHQAEYSFDTVGLTLWNDGWGVPGKPAIDALVHFHRLIVHEGRVVMPEEPGTAAVSRSPR